MNWHHGVPYSSPAECRCCRLTIALEYIARGPCQSCRSFITVKYILETDDGPASIAAKAASVIDREMTLQRASHTRAEKATDRQVRRHSTATEVHKFTASTSVQSSAAPPGKVLQWRRDRLHAMRPISFYFNAVNQPPFTDRSATLND